MTVGNNIFSNPPSMNTDESIEKLRHQLHPREYYYCGTHLFTIIDADRNINFYVGSAKRYLTVKECDVCGDKALVVVVAK